MIGLLKVHIYIGGKTKFTFSAFTWSNFTNINNFGNLNFLFTLNIPDLQLSTPNATK